MAADTGIEVLFLGVDSATPSAGEDTVSFLIDSRILVDCGWAAALRLLDHGHSPLDLDYLVFTHLHHDHYLGLPQLLFYRWMRRCERPLTVVGPAADLEPVVDLAGRFLQLERFGHRPLLELRPLTPGETFTGDTFRLRTAPTIHPVQGAAYRYEPNDSEATLAFTGDTAPCPALAPLADAADLLVHEASFGASAPTATAANTHGHSGAPDAARLAVAAGVGQLALVHTPVSARESALAAAQAIFPASFYPANGQRLRLIGPGER